MDFFANASNAVARAVGGAADLALSSTYAPFTILAALAVVVALTRWRKTVKVAHSRLS
jgi:hypothetical protein